MTFNFFVGNRRDVLRAGAATLVALSIGSHAQSGWPTKPVTLIASGAKLE